MQQATHGNDIVPVIQVVFTSDNNRNVLFYQDGYTLGAITTPDADRLITVLRAGGADVTDLRAAYDATTPIV